MGYLLTDTNKIKNGLTREDYKNVCRVIEMMKQEELSLEFWRLDEIPDDFTYCFYNPKTKEAFDYEPDEGQLRPHYHRETQSAQEVTQIPTLTIREAIKNYYIPE